MNIVRVNWSGGKDSTCAVINHIQLGHYVKAVCYIPMFDGDIPLITRAHYSLLTENKLFNHENCALERENKKS